MKLVDKLKEIEPKLTADVETFKKYVSELYEFAKTDKERDTVTEFIESVLAKDSDTISTDFQLLCVKAQLLEIDEILPYSYIAKTYFNKSKAWLSQRLRGYSVNGKRARFTHDELIQFNTALKDISKKIGSVTFV